MTQPDMIFAYFSISVKEKKKKKKIHFSSTNIHILIFDWLYFLRRASEPKNLPDEDVTLVLTLWSSWSPPETFSVPMEVTYI